MKKMLTSVGSMRSGGRLNLVLSYTCVLLCATDNDDPTYVSNILKKIEGGAFNARTDGSKVADLKIGRATLAAADILAWVVKESFPDKIEYVWKNVPSLLTEPALLVIDSFIEKNDFHDGNIDGAEIGKSLILESIAFSKDNQSIQLTPYACSHIARGFLRTFSYAARWKCSSFRCCTLSPVIEWRRAPQKVGPRV